MPPEKKVLDMKMIGIFVSLFVVCAGLIGQWYLNKANIASLQADHKELEQYFMDYKDKTDDRIMQMKVDITSSTTDIATIKTDIAEIKQDIKTLLSRPQ